MKQKLLFLVALLTALSVFSAEYFVDASMSDDTGAATNWATAKQTIQAAVDLTVDGDTVWVTNGVYDVGGRITPGGVSSNRICITNAVTVQSINGPDVTIIDAKSSARGIFMTNYCSIAGFTITGGRTASGGDCFLDQSGSGIWMTIGCLATNCTISENIAFYDGAGAFLSYGGALNNCVLKDNISEDDCGGGVCLLYGGSLNSCVLSSNSATYHGGGAFCFSGGVLNDCILMDNSAVRSGGGVYLSYGGTVNNSVINGNSAGSSTDGGGGIYLLRGGIVNNCTINSNKTTGQYGVGGGARLNYGGKLSNCTLSGNQSAYHGGGVAFYYFGILDNCIVWGNSAKIEADLSNVQNDTIRSVCASYSYGVAHGVNGCITNNPLFVDAVNGDFRLQSNSPCINTGNNDYAPEGTDLAGNPRVIGGSVDMGAYEFYATQDDYDSDGIPNGWAAEHFGGINRADANAVCSNGVNTIRQAYIAGLDPNDPDSKLLTSFLRSPTSGNELQWQGVSGRVYAVYYSTNLISGFQPLETNIPWSAGCFTDSVHHVHGQLFYKLDVRFDNSAESGGGGVEPDNPFNPGGGSGGGDTPATPI